MFERIEAFFRRLDTHIEVAPNQGMVDTITAILVEVLNILAIATREIKQGRMSKVLAVTNESSFNRNVFHVRFDTFYSDGREPDS